MRRTCARVYPRPCVRPRERREVSPRSQRTRPFIAKTVNAFRSPTAVVRTCACGSCCFSAGDPSPRRTARRAKTRAGHSARSSTRPRPTTTCPTAAFPAASSVSKTCAQTFVHRRLHCRRLHNHNNRHVMSMKTGTAKFVPCVNTSK